MPNNAIGAAAKAFAWPAKTSIKKYKIKYGGQPYGGFKKALNAAYPYKTRKNWSHNARVGASCDVFAGVCIRYSGADKNFPRGLGKYGGPGQIYHLRKSDKWRKVKSSEKLKGGDVQICNHHIRIVVQLSSGKRVAEAGFITGRYGHIGGKAGRGGYTTYRSTVLPETFTGSFGETTEDSSGNIVQGIAAIAKTQAQKQVEDAAENFELILDNIIEYGQQGESDAEGESDNATTIEEQYTILKLCQKDLETLLTVLNKENLTQLSIELLKTNYYDKALASIEKNKIKTTYPDDTELLGYITELENLAKSLIDDGSIKWTYTETPVAITEEYKASKQSIETKYAADLSTAKSNLESIRAELFQYDNSNYTKKIDDLNIKISEYNQEIAEIQNTINLKSKNYNIALSLLDKYNQQLEQAEKSLETFETDNFSDEYTYWNKNIIQNPSTLNFWLEFLDTEGELSQFNIELIGDRPKVVNSDTAKSIYFKEIPALLFVESDDDVAKYKNIFTGYNIVNITSTLANQLTLSAQGKSIKDVLDDNLYQYGYCSEEINLTTIPIYYLEPGEIITVYDKASNINGKYVISKISMPLTYNGTMQITATKIPLKLY